MSLVLAAPRDDINVRLSSDGIAPVTPVVENESRVKLVMCSSVGTVPVTRGIAIFRLVNCESSDS